MVLHHLDKGLFTHTVSAAASVKVYHYAGGYGHFDGQNGCSTHLVHHKVCHAFLTETGTETVCVNRL